MKLLTLLALILATSHSMAQDLRERGGRGPDRGGFEAYPELILQISDSVIAKAQPVTQKRKDDLAFYRSELNQCSKMRPQFMVECLRENSLALIDLAFSAEQDFQNFGICQLKSDASIWAGDNKNYASIPSGGECQKVKAWSKIQKLEGVRSRFSSYNSSSDGYKVRVLDGVCAGAEGYMIYPYVENASCK